MQISAIMRCLLCSEVHGCCTHFTTAFRALNAQTLVTITLIDCVLGFLVRSRFKHCFRLVACTRLGFSSHLSRSPLSCRKLQELKPDLSMFCRLYGCCHYRLRFSMGGCVSHAVVKSCACRWTSLPPTKHIAYCVECNPPMSLHIRRYTRQTLWGFAV